MPVKPKLSRLAGLHETSYQAVAAIPGSKGGMSPTSDSGGTIGMYWIQFLPDTSEYQISPDTG